MSTFKLITNAYIQNPGKDKFRGDILIGNGKIVDVTGYEGELQRNSLSNDKNIEIFDAKGALVTPGLIDQHIHGGCGCDFNTADVNTIIEFLLKLPAHGVTAICPTVMTDRLENIKNQINRIKRAKASLPQNAAKIIGINIEGPFLNPKYKGAHSVEHILPPTIENYQQIEDEEIKIITIAPELDENGELAEYLANKGVIASAGHTDAANMKNLKHVTHIFNAMTPLHHRNPGLIGGALADNAVYVEIIADQQHIHPDVLKLAVKAKPLSKVIFISDCLPLASSDEDSMVFGGQEIFKHNEIAVNKDGQFTGSLLFLDSIIKKNLKLFKLKDLLMFCSQNPAQNLGLSGYGSIEKGNYADLVVWDENFEIMTTFM